MRICRSAVMAVLVFFVIDERNATFLDLEIFFAHDCQPCMRGLAQVVGMCRRIVPTDRTIQSQLYASFAAFQEIEHGCASLVGYELHLDWCVLLRVQARQRQRASPLNTLPKSIATVNRPFVTATLLAVCVVPICVPPLAALYSANWKSQFPLTGLPPLSSCPW